MQKNIFFNIVGIFIGVIEKYIFSILGRYKIWIFTNFLNNNLFIAAIINLAIAFLVKPFRPESGREMRDIETAISFDNEEDKKVRGKMSTLLFFVSIFVVLSALSFFLPEIRL